MQTQDILKKIQQLCSELIGIDPGEVTIHADLRDDLGLSLPELAQIFTELQNTFHFVVPKEHMKQLLSSMETVEDLIACVEDEL